MQSASGGFKFFGGREDKYQEAADLYIAAANAFRMQQSSLCPYHFSNLTSSISSIKRTAANPFTLCVDREAGQTFEKAAQIQINHLKEPDDAANTYVDAFKVYRAEAPEDAVRCLEFSINQYCTKGNFRRAASHKENLGDLFENQMGDLKRACDAYETAAGWYEGDGAGAYVYINHTCLLLTYLGRSIY